MQLRLASDAVIRDLRYAIRAIRKRPLASAAAIGTLAIGIGLNAAVFSVVDWVLLRPLPFPSSHELVRLSTAGTSPATAPADLTYSEFALFAKARVLQSSAAFSTATRVVGGAGIEPAHVAIARLDGDLFSTLRVTPSLGRPFAADELSSGAPVAVLGDAVWRSRLQADPTVVGRAIAIDAVPHTIVGVMPAGRGYPPGAELWRPLTSSEREDDDRELQMIARLRTDATPTEASAELATLASAASNQARTAWADELHTLEVRGFTAGLAALFVSAALILSIACANVAALAAARSADRVSELAVRGALGASRARLFSQLIAESLVLAIAGGLTGLLIGGWALEVMVAMAPPGLPRLAEITIDARVATIGFAASLVAGLFAGIAPALQLTGKSSPAALHPGASVRVSSRSTVRRGLVLAQIAMSVVLVTGATLLGRSLLNLVTTAHGFDADRLVAVDLNLRGASIENPAQLFGALAERAAAIADVQDVSIAMRLPTQTIGLRTQVVTPERATVSATLRPIDSRFFTTTGVPVLQGRGFERTDTASAPRVAIVNTAFAKRLDGRLAIGSRLTASFSDASLTVVGVAGDTTPGGEPDRPALYVPIEQSPIGGGYLIVRGAADPASIIPALTSQLRGAAPALPLDRIRRLSDDLAAGRAISRFNTFLAGTFAALALLLATIGVYGLAAGEVAARWRELAVRLALGSSHRSALWSVVRPSSLVLATGATLGLIAAAAVTPALSTLLYGITARDVSTLVTAPIVLASAGLAAALLAAMRVLRADPATTLRGE